MKKLFVCGMILGIINCMGVQVPEEYVSDAYYGNPKVVAVSASTSTSLSSVPVQVKFATPMNTGSVTVNTVDQGCSGTIQISATVDNFGANTCLQFTGLSSANRDSVFNGILVADVEPNSEYLVKVLKTATDFLGKSLESDSILSFKTGIPAGSEPQASASAVGKISSGTFGLVVVFTRAVPSSSVVVINGNCADSTVVLSLNNGFADGLSPCNSGLGTVVPSGATTVGGITTYTTYTISYPTLTDPGPVTPIYYRVKSGLVDRLGIATIVAYNSQFP